MKYSRKKLTAQANNIIDKSTGAEGNHISASLDATQIRPTSLLTRVSDNFFIPPIANEADVKLYSASKRWMNKVL